MASRSASVAILDVAWRSERAARALPRSCRRRRRVTRMSWRPASRSSTVTCVASGVERVLDQLLDHGGRPLDHLAGGDLVHEVLGQPADPAHAGRSRSCRCHSASRLSACERRQGPDVERGEVLQDGIERRAGTGRAARAPGAVRRRSAPAAERRPARSRGRRGCAARPRITAGGQPGQPRDLDAVGAVGAARAAPCGGR